jgi:amidase
MAGAKQDWQEVAAAKRASLLASIPSEWLIPREILPADSEFDVTAFRKTSGLFTDIEIRITEAGASSISGHIVHRIWSAEKVTLAFCKAAAIAHQLVGQDSGYSSGLGLIH